MASRGRGCVVDIRKHCSLGRLYFVLADAVLRMKDLAMEVRELNGVMVDNADVP